MKIPFKATSIDGCELRMSVSDINPAEIRFNTKTREIFVVYEDSKYTLEDIDQMSWQSLKKLTIDHGGIWESKQSSIDFLVGRTKK